MKKTLLLLSLALTLGGVAQSQTLKERIAASTSLSDRSSDQWTKLLQQKKQKPAETQRNAPKAKSAILVADASIFTEITSFPYELETTFTAETPVVYQGIRGFAFKFTLTETKVLNIKTADGYFDMGVFADENLNNFVINGTNFVYAFAPGTYYIIAPDFGDRFGNEGEFAVHFQFSDIAAAVTPIAVPCNQGITLTAANTIELYGETAALYQFTLTQAQALNFSISTTGSPVSMFLLGTYNGGNNFNALLAAGTYALAVFDEDDYLSTNSSLAANLTISINEDIQINAIRVPLDTVITLTNQNTAEIYGERGQFYSFNLSEPKILHIYTESENAYLALSNSTGNYIGGGQNFTSYLLPAGSYFLSVMDNGYLQTNASLTLDIKVDAFTSYSTLDYSTAIAAGQTLTGDDSRATQNVTLGDGSPYLYTAASYHFAAQAGHFYKVTFKGYATENITAGIALLKGNLTGDINYDLIDGSPDIDFNATQFTESLTYYADESGINILLGFIQPAENIFYSITVEEVPDTPLAFQSITIPYLNEQIDFTAEAGAVRNSDEYLRGFTFTLNEAATLYFYGRNEVLQWGPNLYISQTEFDKSLNNTDNYFINDDGISLPLAAGTYYIALGDDDYSNLSYYTTYLSISTESTKPVVTTVETITLPALLNSAGITTVAYAANLSYENAGYFNKGVSDIVYDEDYNFRDGNKVFAKAYKLTGLPAGDNVKIHVANSNDAYLYIYKKDGDDFDLVAANDDGGIWGDLDSYLDFTADAAVDYYIIATTYENYASTDGTSYSVEIWVGSEDDKPTTEILSTSASETTVEVSYNATLLELRTALLALNITATFSNTSTLPVENNPFAWTFNEDKTAAYYTNINVPLYPKAENYTPATVTIVYLSSALNETGAASLLLYPNPAVDYVTVSGLTGSEKISILDLNGKTITQSTAKGETATFAVSGLSKGVYLVAVQNGGKVSVLKFVK
ncbi:MAG: T9SS type A sorting domain-containing protein [Prevotellaceae bacterium]|jgi:hypothetical protein|nr:T9SS type A sorting domain-containing protein [Prevotellaceae bacterium]